MNWQRTGSLMYCQVWDNKSQHVVSMWAPSSSGVIETVKPLKTTENLSRCNSSGFIQSPHASLCQLVNQALPVPVCQCWLSIQYPCMYCIQPVWACFCADECPVCMHMHTHASACMCVCKCDTMPAWMPQAVSPRPGPSVKYFINWTVTWLTHQSMTRHPKH